MQTLEHEPLLPDEQPVLEEISRMLANDSQISLLIGDEGEVIELPRAVSQVFKQVIQHMANDRTVFLVPMGPILTTQEAADILHVSRPYLIKLLEEGEIPFSTVGTHRRVHIRDVLTYQKRRKAEQEEALNELTRLSQELGLYD